MARVELPAPRDERLADFRVAILPPIPWIAVDGQIAAALDALATRLGRLGWRGQAQPQALGDHREQYRLYRWFVSAVTGARVDDETRRQRIEMYRKAGDKFSLAHLRGLDGRPGDYILWNGQREQYRASWRAFFQEWDVLLAPAINVLAYPHIDRAWPADDSDLTITFTIDGLAVPYLHGLVYPSLSTVAGQPRPPPCPPACRARACRSGSRRSARISRTAPRFASPRCSPRRWAASGRSRRGSTRAKWCRVLPG